MKRIALTMVGIGGVLFTGLLVFAQFSVSSSHSASVELANSGASATTGGSSPEVPFVYHRVVEVCKSGCNYTAPSEAIAVAQDYDLVRIQAGTYTDCAVLPSATHIWMRGVGGMVHMTGAVCENKGALVINGDQTIIENFEFSNLEIPCEMGQNAVGIRLQAGDLFVINSYFHDSQGGMLTNSTRRSNISILNSRFSRLGRFISRCASNPFTWFHNIYVGVEASFTLRNTIAEDNPTGNIVKSRALKSIITCNQIRNGYDATYTKNGYLIDLPQGGDEYLRNNLIAQGPHVKDQQILVAYGAEIAKQRNPVQSLELSGNKLVNEFDKGTFIEMFSATTKAAKLSGNLLVGPGKAIDGVTSSVSETDDHRYLTRSPNGENPAGWPPNSSSCSFPIGTGPAQ